MYACLLHYCLHAMKSDFIQGLCVMVNCQNFPLDYINAYVNSKTSHYDHLGNVKDFSPSLISV